MLIEVITLFPQMVEEALAVSIIGRAQAAGLAVVRAVDLREFAEPPHRITDDTPCGGGGGMIMKVEPVAAALDSLAADRPLGRVILTDPRGVTFTQELARQLATEERITIICGRYEGVDERVRERLVTDCVTIGDYVVTGGELPALVMVDAVVRLLPGALGDADATRKDSFSEHLLEYPQYTRPRSFRGWDVPDILFDGHHARIAAWRRYQQLDATRRLRPDMWARHNLTAADSRILESCSADAAAKL